MSTPGDCKICKGEKKIILGSKFFICGYCMQPVSNPVKEVAKEHIGTESTSLLTLTGATGLAFLGLDIPLLNSVFIGLLLTFLIFGPLKYMLFSVGAIAGVILILFLGENLFEYSLYFIEQVILFFDLWESMARKESVI